MVIETRKFFGVGKKKEKRFFFSEPRRENKKGIPALRCLTVNWVDIFACMSLAQDILGCRKIRNCCWSRNVFICL